MIGNRIKELRTDKDFPQKYLAENVGISRQALHSIENGLSIPSIEVALKLAEVLKVKVDKLFWLAESRDERNETDEFTLFNHKILK